MANSEFKRPEGDGAQGQLPADPEPDMVRDLMLAAASGKSGAIGRLAAIARHPLAVDESGRTALMVAALHGSIGAVELLLPHSDARALDRKGRDALVWAASGPGGAAIECVMALIDACDVKLSDGDGRDALMAAASRGNADVCAVLIQKGADPLAAGRDGLTALMWGARNGHQGVVEALAPCSDLAARAGGFDRETAAQMARSSGNLELAAYIEARQLAAIDREALEMAAAKPAQSMQGGGVRL